MRIVSGYASDEERGEDFALRPFSFDDFIGQSLIKENLKIMIDAGRLMNEPIDHILFSGRPGLGKTTLAYIVANEMRSRIRITSGPVIEKPDDIISILVEIKRGDVLFIDEIHRLRKVIEEILYSVMEDFKVNLIIKHKDEITHRRISVEPFTLIGSTIRAGHLSPPFRDRFGYSARLTPYNIEEIAKIIKRNSSILKIGIEDEGILEIARRSRGVPRIANRLLKRTRIFSLAREKRKVTKDVAESAINMLGIDEFGLDETDREILRLIAIDFRGGPVGIDSISANIGEDIETIKYIYEPYLIREKFIIRTLHGRKTTKKTDEYLHIKDNILEMKRLYTV